MAGLVAGKRAGLPGWQRKAILEKKKSSRVSKKIPWFVNNVVVAEI